MYKIGKYARQIKLTSILKNNYVRQKELQVIKQKFIGKQDIFDKLKMYVEMFFHIAAKGFKQAKADFYIYKQLRRKQYLSQQQRKQLTKIQTDIVRMGPIIFIQILPLSGPLFLLYMYTYPQSIPSWFIVDSNHNQSILERQKKQLEAVEYFQKLGKTKDDINLQKMSLQQVRKLSQLFFGYYRDGTRGINKLGKFKNINLRYFIRPSISKKMITNKLQKIFQLDLINQHIIETMTFQQRIKWKYQQIMVYKKYHIGDLIQQYQDIPQENISAENLQIKNQQSSQKNKQNNNKKQ